MNTRVGNLLRGAAAERQHSISGRDSRDRHEPRGARVSRSQRAEGQ